MRNLITLSASSDLSLWVWHLPGKQGKSRLLGQCIRENGQILSVDVWGLGKFKMHRLCNINLCFFFSVLFLIHSYIFES